MDCFVGAQHAAPQQCKSRIEESVFQSNGNQQASWFGQRNLGSIGDCSRSACWFGCAVRGTLCLAVSVQHSREKAARVRLRIARHLLGSARRDNLPALVPALGAQIDQPVRGFDDVKIVFDDQQRSAALQQLAERAEELSDVVEMQTCRRFVENVEDTLIVGAAEVRCQLQALRFPAGKRCRRLPEAQVAESNFIQDSEFGNNLGYVHKKRQRFANRQLQYLVNILPVIPHFQNAALEVRYHGKNVHEILQLTVREALAFFVNVPKIVSKLRVLNEIGLGYLRLGQSATTLSGGEAQRLKLAAHLSGTDNEGILYILDEPTTGLHFDDIAKLLSAFRKLLEGGASLLVIEHNLDVIKSADWLIDLGPEGGDQGGKIIATGTPEQVARNTPSHTGRFLAKVLNGNGQARSADGQAKRATNGASKATGPSAAISNGGKIAPVEP